MSASVEKYDFLYDYMMIYMKYDDPPHRLSSRFHYTRLERFRNSSTKSSIGRPSFEMKRMIFSGSKDMMSMVDFIG